MIRARAGPGRSTRSVTGGCEIVSVLVTGAAGFIGSHLTESFLASGLDVVGLDNFDPFYDRGTKEANLSVAFDHDGFQFVEGDIRDSEALQALPDDIDGIVHLAALAGVRPSITAPDLYSEVNLLGTSRLLKLAGERGIKTFLFASSSSVYGNNEKVPFSEDDRVDNPISPYAATKKGGELLCHCAGHLHGLATICLRFFTVYGPRQRPDLAIHKFARLLRTGSPIPMFGDGSTSRDYTYITDILDGVTRAYEWGQQHPGAHEVVNLGESKTVTLAEMIRVLGEELGEVAQVQRMPMQPGDVQRTFADVTKAEKLFGYKPGVDFREGIRGFVEWFDKEATALLGRIR